MPVFDAAAPARSSAASRSRGARLYATDFHNARVARLRPALAPVRVARGAFVDRVDPGVVRAVRHRGDRRARLRHVRLAAPVNGNDAPTGGYVDEFTSDGRLVARLAARAAERAVGARARAVRASAGFGGDLLVGNFGDGTIDAYRRSRGRWIFDGHLRGRDHEPIAISGLWSLAFGNGGLAGSSHTLFFTAGPHTWRGATEQSVHGLLGAIELVRLGATSSVWSAVGYVRGMAGDIELRVFRGTRRSSTYRAHAISEAAAHRLAAAAAAGGFATLAAATRGEEAELDKRSARRLADEASGLRGAHSHSRSTTTRRHWPRSRTGAHAPAAVRG